MINRINLLICIYFDESIWHTFYKTQYIKQRKNKKQLQKFVPLKVRTDEIKKDLANAEGILTLDKF